MKTPIFEMIQTHERSEEVMDSTQNPNTWNDKDPMHVHPYNKHRVNIVFRWWPHVTHANSKACWLNDENLVENLIKDGTQKGWIT